MRHQTSTSAAAARQGFHGFVGDNKRKVTPVPIPNTEVKFSLPMILLSGKVGHCRLLEPRPGNWTGLFRFTPCMGCMGCMELMGFMGCLAISEGLRLFL